MEYLKILIQILKKCNSNNTAPSIGTIAGQCSDQRKRNYNDWIIRVRRNVQEISSFRQVSNYIFAQA